MFLIISYQCQWISIESNIYWRFGGARPACPTPRNREIGFVSSSFSFRACRACGRGEAVWARARRPSNARPWSCEFPSGSAASGEQYLLLCAWVLSILGIFLKAWGLIWIGESMRFKNIENSRYSFCMGFEKWSSKTQANDIVRS